VTPEDLPDEVFSGKAHRLTMGLRPLDMATWLDPDPLDPQLARKRALLESDRAQVFAALPGTEEQCREVATAVADWVGRDLPGEDHPLVEAAAMVRDDICVMAQREGRWLLVAAVVCFPSRWRLADKLGQDVMTIHDPVPRYRQTLEAPTTKAMDVAAFKPRWRVNWTLLDDPELFAPVGPRDAAHTVGPDSYLRVERQCLVPVGGSVVFTIRTTVVRVGDLGDGRAKAVLTAAAATPDDLARYRGWGR
jgi:hypothetical protein